MKLIIEKNRILFGDKFLLLDDLHTIDFYEFSNKNVYKYSNASIYVNELFINFIQNFIALEKFVLDNHINQIVFKDSSEELLFYFSDIAEKHNIKLEKGFFFLKQLIILKFYAELIASTLFLFFLMLKISNKKKEKGSGEISIVRTGSSKNKMKQLNVNIEYEDPYNSNSIYRLFKRGKRVKWVLQSLYDSFNQYNEIKKLMNTYTGKGSKYLISFFYGKRLVHTNLYKYLIDHFFKTNDFSTFYTGNNLDRFALIEEQVAKNNNLKLICIPHGLEYGFKFPKCFTGDIFYATSKFAASYLNMMYNSSKFEFNKVIINAIFKRNSLEVDGNKIVFFSEPREREVNHYIIQNVLPLLKTLNLSLSLKLHPKDCLEEYSKYEVEIIEDFDKAIKGNICFSRKSTTLIEALYNNSSASAILLNNKDKSIFYSFPSLQSDKVNKSFSIEDLTKWIKKEYLKKEDNEKWI
jgi:hypothetical protein